MKNKMKFRAVALAIVLSVTTFLGIEPQKAEAAAINGVQINQNLQTINASSRYGNSIKYINIHYTGAPGDAYANTKYFAGAYRGSSAHYFVGYNGDVWQSVSENLAAWSVGGKKYPGTKGGSVYGSDTNYNSINIEMCVRTKGSTSDTSTDWYFEDATISSTVKLVQGLMKKYNVPISRVVRHYDVVGKYCPNPFVLNDDSVTWSDFKKMITGDKSVPVNGNASNNNNSAGNSSGSGTSGNNSGQNNNSTGTNGNKSIDVKYRAYVGYWLPWVLNYNDYNGDGYAGVPFKGISGLQAYTIGNQEQVGNLQYRLHVNGKWLSWVTDASSPPPEDYAGIKGKNTDGIQVKLINRPGYHAEVRVQLTSRSGWLAWSSQYSGGADDYAGIYGNNIDRVQIRIVKD